MGKVMDASNEHPPSPAINGQAAASVVEQENPNIAFQVEVSARYHDFRRATLGICVNIIRLVSLCGSIITFLAVSSLVKSSPIWLLIAALASIAIGVVNLFDLVFGIDSAARIHTSLYQRFKALQAEIARNQWQWETLSPEWEAKAQSIRNR